MAWGASKSIEDLLKRLQSNDPALTSLHIFQGKKFDEEVIDTSVFDKGQASNPTSALLWAPCKTNQLCKDVHAL